MVDFGLVSLFAVQCGLVALVYHAWRGVKAEISTLESMRSGIEAIKSQAIVLLQRIVDVEGNPKALTKRIVEIEAIVSSLEKALDKLGGRVTSQSARISASLRKPKHVEDDDPEAEGAAQAEAQEEIQFSGAPLSHRGSPEDGQEETGRGVPAGFGVLKRRVG